MKIVLKQGHLSNVPVLLAWPETTRNPLPTVLWFHGFTACKEDSRPELTSLAQAGFLAVGVDNAGHGERKMPNFDLCFDQGKHETDRLFYELVAQTAAEVPAVVEALCRERLSDEQRLGVGGVSMGGHIAYGALAREKRLRAGVAITASPVWPRDDSPHVHLKRFFPAAIFSITSEKDEVVSPKDARDFHEALSSHYRDCHDRLVYREIPGAMHMMPEKNWNCTIADSVDWLVRFLT